MYDLCIIGGGPAGLTAALYSGRAGRKTLLLEEKAWGGQMAETGSIENYPGLPGTEGYGLAETAAKQVKAVGVESQIARVDGLEKSSDCFRISTGEAVIEARRIILAMGVRRRKLEVPGEELLQGHGVSYCAVCDGGFFRGKTVAVVGGGNTALEDALYLSGICEKVFLLVRGEIRAHTVLKNRVQAQEKIAVYLKTEVQEILGAEKVTGVCIQKEGTRETIALSGVFIAIGLAPDPELYHGLVETTAEGYILAGENCRTSCPGVYVAGDLRNKEIRQIITAMADGAVAAELSGREL